MKHNYIKEILRANVYDVAVETPLINAHFLSKRLNNKVLIKREDLQPVFSFKLRGAYNKMSKLSEDEKSAGVVAASAGNHAQGVAMAAKKMNINAVIVMPRTTPEIKVISVKERGANVVLHGDTFDEACRFAQDLKEKEGRVFIHPYDDPDVIAGQGTIGVELLKQEDQIDKIFVPVGGGGLIAGIASYVKYVRPEIKIIGVEAEDSACLKAALEADSRVVLDEVGIFADGVAVAQIGEETFRVAKETVDDVVTVTTDEICAAVKDLFDDTRSIAEPAGALSIAGLKKYSEQNSIENEILIAIESGANVNFDRLRHISERSEIGEHREAIIAVTIPEKPGSFLELITALENTNITEFNYRYSDQNDAVIFVGLTLKNGLDELEKISNKLKEHFYPVQNLTENEIAKTHVRYMVGGHSPNLKNELAFRFEFPERPGALLKFLTLMQQQWNISMFHYRNHGAAYGRIFMGIQVDENDRDQLNKFLDELGYRYREESSNLAYELFLK